MEVGNPILRSENGVAEVANPILTIKIGIMEVVINPKTPFHTQIREVINI